MEDRLELTKENWASLTDDEKTHELQKLIPGVTYQSLKKDYERYKELGKEMNLVFDHPVVCLELIDPVMAPLLLSWMYRHGDKIDNIPVFGYKVMELFFDKSSLMEFTDDEKHVLSHAMEILSNRIKPRD